MSYYNRKYIYKVISGTPSFIEDKLNKLSCEGWYIHTVSTTSTTFFFVFSSVEVTVVLRRDLYDRNFP
jgi:hypothetical protein